MLKIPVFREGLYFSRPGSIHSFLIDSPVFFPAVAAVAAFAVLSCCCHDDVATEPMEGYEVGVGACFPRYTWEMG